jgi:hypothetical protein
MVKRIVIAWPRRLAAKRRSDALPIGRRAVKTVANAAIP